VEEDVRIRPFPSAGRVPGSAKLFPCFSRQGRLDWGRERETRKTRKKGRKTRSCPTLPGQGGRVSRLSRGEAVERKGFRVFRDQDLG